MDLHRALAAWRSLSSQLALRRRLVVAALTGIAIISGLSALRPSQPDTKPVLVAARNLSGGHALLAADLRLERLPTSDLPAGALASTASAVGRLLGAPMREGEPLTDVRLLSPSLLKATDAPGDVAVPVRVADGPAALALVHAGDLIDVIAAADPGDGGPDTSSVVVHDVRVLATPTHDGESDESGTADSAGLLIVEVTSHQAAALAATAEESRLSVAVRRQP